MLDLCCGDGTYSGLFYSGRAGSVDAVDRDPRAVALAKRRHSKPNVQYFCRDILLEPFPRPEYDVVFFFVAIEHFSIEAGTDLLQKIGSSLSQRQGVLFGSTPILPHRGGHNDEHDNEFLSVEQLKLFLEPHFSRVEVWCSNWPMRTECYFTCEGPILLTEDHRREAMKRYADRVGPEASPAIH